MLMIEKVKEVKLKNSLKYIKNIFKVLIWPILFSLGTFIINYIFVAIFNSKEKGTMSNSEFIEYINTLEYQEKLNEFINSKSLLIILITVIIFLPILFRVFKKYRTKNNFKLKNIFIPTIKAMEKEGCPFSGCLYFGLMLTPKGPKVIEYNCRFGDPETQVVLPLLKTDLFEIMQAVSSQTLDKVKVEFEDKSACCVIMASKGYPESYEKGYEITMDKDLDNVFVAGAKLENGKLLTNGGRVLGVTAVDKDLKGAIKKAYEKVEKISFGNAYYRKDIGKRALKAYGEE